MLEPFAEEGKAEHQHEHRQARVEGGPPDAGGHHGEGLLQVATPLGNRFRQAETEETEATEHQHRVGRIEGEQHGHGGDHGAQKVATQDPKGSGAEGAGGLDEQLGLHLGGLVAHHPEILGHVHHAEGGGRVGQPPAEQEGQHHRQQQHGQGVEGVHEQHQQPIHAAPQVATDHPEGHPDQQSQQQGDHHHLQSHAAARQGAYADVAAEAIGTAPVGQRWGRMDGGLQTGVGIPQQAGVDQGRGEQGRQAINQHNPRAPEGHLAREAAGRPKGRHGGGSGIPFNTHP